MAYYRAIAIYHRPAFRKKVINLCVSVIIVNYNSGRLLARCLKCLARQTVTPQQVMVVDNASTDGSCDLIETLDGMTLVRAETNLGFAAGNNLALARCSTPFVALLNPDAFPEPDWLESLLDAAEKYPQYAMFGSRLVSAENPRLLDGDGDYYHVSGIVWREGHMRPVKAPSAPREVFSPCAAAALYRTEAVREAGGFDPDFFCYLEDIDLGFRLRLKGYRCLQVPQSVVYHMGSAVTGGKRGDFAVYYGHRNLVWVYFKNMPSYLFWLFLPLHVFMNLISLGLAFKRGQSRVMARAKFDAVTGIPRAWRKRTGIQGDRRVSAINLFKVMDKRILR